MPTFFNKRRYQNKKQRANEMADIIKVILPENAKLVSFEYDARCFGNMMCKIKVEDQMHTFIVDRGEIVHNDKLLCDSSYHQAGRSDAFPKLLEMIKKKLS